jgi:hypothetical protein
MGIDRSGADAGAEQVEENNPADRRPAPPPDRPGQEPEGVPSRLEVRRAMAAGEQPGTSAQAFGGERDTGAQLGTEKRPQARDSQAAAQELDENAVGGQRDAETAGEERANASDKAPRSTEFVSPAPEAPGRA